MLIAPTIHLNGTSKASLMAEYLAALEAMRNAIEAVQAITVHGRDFYVKEEGALLKATSQKRKQLTALDSVYAELEQIALMIDEQG